MKVTSSSSVVRRSLETSLYGMPRPLKLPAMWKQQPQWVVTANQVRGLKQTGNLCSLCLTCSTQYSLCRSFHNTGIVWLWSCSSQDKIWWILSGHQISLLLFVVCLISSEWTSQVWELGPWSRAGWLLSDSFFILPEKKKVSFPAWVPNTRPDTVLTLDFRLMILTF